MNDRDSRDVQDETVTLSAAVPVCALRNGDLLAQRFAILRFVGRGGMGEVYEASDRELGGTVALKVLRPHLIDSSSSLARFRREVQTARQVTHPNVCRVFDLGFHSAGEESLTFLTMEFLPGVTLSQRLRSSGPMAPSEALPLLRQIASALDALHAKGIVHRDLKPGNIMISAGTSGTVPQAVVTDFGLARTALSANDGPDSGPTQFGQVVGTPGYMAPEQQSGGTVTAASDIYSFGLIVRDMVGNGAKPVPRNWERLWQRCLETDPSKRPASAGAAVAELSGGFLANRSRAWMFAAIASMALVAALLAAFRWMPRASTGPVRHQVAVLAFTVPGHDPEVAVFADGLMEDITGRLSQFEGQNARLLVVPASFVRQQSAKTPEDARAKFSADEVVQGSLQTQGERVRLRLTVIDTHQMRQIGTVIVEDVRSNALGLEDAAVGKLAAALNLRILPGQSNESVANVAPGAYDFYLQARGYLQRGDKLAGLESAASLFNKVLQVDPKSASAYAGLAEAEHAKYNLTRDSQWMDAAIQSCSRALALNPSLPDAHIILGRIHLDAGKFEEARNDFETALQSDPRDSRGYQGLASAYEGLKRFPEAENTYRKAIALRPEDWNGYRQLGLFYYHRNNLDQAIAQFQQVVALTPDNAMGYTNLGAFQILKRDPEAATKSLTRALELDPNRATTLANLAKLYFDREDYPKAIGLYSRAVKLNAKDFRFHGSLGIAYLRSHGLAQGTATLKEAIRLVDGELRVNPNRAELYSYKALYLSNLGNAEQVPSLLRRAEQLSPGDANIEIRAAETLANIGTPAEAVRLLRKLASAGYPVSELKASLPLRPLLAQLSAQ
jgi:tetratricopeptide (TPR) repeat protein